MKKMKKIFLVLTFLVALVGIMQPVIGEATAMGQNGSIRFYGETTTSTTEPTSDTTSDTSEPTNESSTSSSSGGTLPSTSGSGKLPQTGELVGASVTLSGIILLILAVLTVARKKRTEK